MAAKGFIPTTRLNPAHLLQLEKALLEKHYGFLTVSIKGGVLLAEGYCQPTPQSVTYYYKVRYDPNKEPRVYVTSPTIAYNEEIHMYADDHRLCLYYPRDYSWREHSRLFDTIIPWTHKWFLYYELYQVTGKWEHPFVDHRKI